MSSVPALTPQMIALVKSTVPILMEHGEALTTYFYRRMFRGNPEVAPFFNAANQAAGVQQRALASAVCAFAANVDQLEVLGSAVETIAWKHASLRILPEHYPIVGTHLLGSIREVLGEAATDELIEAWGQAYGVLAGVLIAREQEIYRSQAAAPHGWAGFRKFRIIRKEAESSLITSFYLEPADGGKVPSYLPGQYLTIRVPDGAGSTTMRNYSLSSAPAGDHFRISVKREPQGRVSSWLHGLPCGGELEAGPPCGQFVLDPGGSHGRPLVFLSGGIGITPTLCMLEATLKDQPEREILFVHAALQAGTHAFGPRIRELASRHPNLRVHVCYTTATPEDFKTGRCDSAGLVSGELLLSLQPSPDADYYFCGPKPFMASIYRLLLSWGIPAGRIHFEFFGPAQELTSGETAPLACPVGIAAPAVPSAPATVPPAAVHGAVPGAVCPFTGTTAAGA